MDIKILMANYLNKTHAKDIGILLNEYAKDPMGGANELSDDIINNVASKLSKLPNSFTIICYVDGKAAGLINYFENFSTFKCKPLMSIHDIMVSNKFRGLGISQMMLDKLELEAKKRDCCKLTLEVLEYNNIAKNSYLKFGFDSYELDPALGKAMFWEKIL